MCSTEVGYNRLSNLLDDKLLTVHLY